MSKQRRSSSRSRWFVPAEITENTVFMMGALIMFMLREWPKRGLGGFIRRYFTLYRGDFSQMWFRRSEFDAQADFLANKMLRNPGWAIRVIEDVERWSNRFLEAARDFRTVPFADLSDEELSKAFQRVLRWQLLSHGVGASVSWQADADQERVTKAISAMVEERMKKVKSKKSPPKADQPMAEKVKSGRKGVGIPDSVAVVFSTLSSPTEESFMTREEREFLKLASRMFDVRGVRLLVRRTSPSRLEPALRGRHPRLAARLRDHYERWRWMQYGYKGPAYPLSYFLDRLQALSVSATSPAALHRELANKAKATARLQRSLEQSLKLTPHDRQLVRMARRMVFIKEYRKGALYFGMYCYEPFFREVGRRLKLSLDQIWAMNSWEIIDWLEQGRSIPKRELNARLKFAVTYATKTRYEVWTGRKARTFFARIPKEEAVPAGDVTELTGTCASPGEATGIVKIVEVPADMAKMNKGDILVSETTYPSLVPAMKKAAAIVTNAGGLTCHAAIVSRELGIPCVVGTRVANKVLKDGDRVEVDATRGLVQILNR